MKPQTCVFLIVMTSLVLVACGAPATPAPAATPTSLPEIPFTPSAVVPLDERLVATVNIDEHPLATETMIGNHPDEIVIAQDFIWTRTANGHVVQVDPTSNEMVAAVKADTTSDLDHYCHGLGTDGDDIWSCSAADDGDNRAIHVVRIDPESQSVVETVEVGKIFEQFELPYLANRIWVLTGSGEQLVGIDVTTNQPEPGIDLGTRCFQLAAAENSLFAACTLDNLVLRIDPETGEVAQRVTIESPRNIAAANNGIWVTQNNAVVRLDPDSLAPVATFTGLAGVGTKGDIFSSEDAVWVRVENGFLYRIDPASNQIVEQVTPEDELTGGSVVATTDSVWTTAIDDNLLIRLNLQ